MSLASNYFSEVLKELKNASADIAQPASQKHIETISMWHASWSKAWKREAAPGNTLLEFGILLAGLAETCSFYNVADEIFTALIDSALEGCSDNPVAILVTAGEYHRRIMRFAEAEAVYLRAEKLCHDKIGTKDVLKSASKDLGRLYYELAYLNRLRGDAPTTVAWFERSATMCEIAEDWVGAEVANTLRDFVLCEEGEGETATRRLEQHLGSLRELEIDSRIIESGRNGFARRWVLNTQSHLAQAYLADERPQKAKMILDKLYDNSPTSPSAAMNGTLLRIEALTWLQQGDLERCNKALSGSREATEGLRLPVEMGAAIFTMNGVVEALKGNIEGARTEFGLARGCDSDRHNNRLQGLAAAGEAILARDSEDHAATMEALSFGLTKVHRCGTPIRAFLLKIQKGYLTRTPGPTVDDLRHITSRYC